VTSLFIFGIVKSADSTFDSVARPALDMYKERDTRLLVRTGVTSIAAAYNSILDECALRFPAAEAVVLMHQDVEIVGEDFFAQIRARFADPSIGLVGLVGARGVRSVVYWRARLCGRVRENERMLDHGNVTSEVDAIDGMLLALSPACAATLRFDETTFEAFHGYDIDFSFAVTAANMRVVVEPLPVVHHTKGGYGDVGAYLRASHAWRRKWLTNAPLRTRAASWNDELQVVRVSARARLPRRHPR
jgi:hypothetical protein